MTAKHVIQGGEDLNIRLNSIEGPAVMHSSAGGRPPILSTIGRASMDAEFVRDVVLVVLGALVATGAGWWADIRRGLRADRKAERDRKAIAEEADRRRQAERRYAAQVEALAAAAAMAAPVANKITDALDEAKTRPHMIQGRRPGIEQQLAAIEREWNHEWRYVIFGAGRIGYHFAELSMLRGQIQEAATAVEEGVDDAYLRDSIERLGESVD